MGVVGLEERWVGSESCSDAACDRRLGLGLVRLVIVKKEEGGVAICD